MEQFNKQHPSVTQDHGRFLTLSVAGLLLSPAVWLVLSYVVGVPERYLPAPHSAILAARDLDPGLLSHTLHTVARLYVGFALGAMTGVVLGIWLYRLKGVRELLLPTLQALRAVPPVATVPFFLLWFGFSDTGKLLLLVFGIGINLAFSSYQILIDIPAKYLYALRSLGVDIERLPWRISAPLVAERLLPTLRFSLATSLSLVIVAELLGSQVGLGYLIQASRSTFAMHTVMLCVIVLSVVNAVTDWLLVNLWQRIVFWRAI
jgi:ABC-type nitrate/sulfonate/bicarbonate transport system permease component